MEYKELLESIENWLINQGWTKDSTTDNSSFSNTYQSIVGEMIINGQKQVQTATVKEYLKHDGEGWVEDKDNHIMLSQWTYSTGGKSISFLIEEPEELSQYISSHQMRF